MRGAIKIVDDKGWAALSIVHDNPKLRYHHKLTRFDLLASVLACVLFVSVIAWQLSGAIV